MDKIHIGLLGLEGACGRADLGSRQQPGSAEARGNSSSVFRVEMGSGSGNFERLATENL